MAAVALTLTACGGSLAGDEGGGGGGGDAGDGEQVTLRFSWWGSDTRHEMTQELIDAFEAENPNITVEGEFTGFGDYWDRLATSAAGGNAPDVIQHESRYVREYADRGALLDLDQYIPDVIDTSQLDESVLSTGQVDGTTYAIPTGINAYTVVADPQAFEEAGVELPDDESWSWEDLLSTGAEVTSATSGNIFGLQNMGFVDAGLEVFARQRGESTFTEDGAVGLSDETLAAWFETILASRDSGAEPQPSVTVETQAGGVDQSLLATNRGALGFWWTNELPTLASSSGRELELLRFPGESDQTGMFLKPAMFWSASADSEHPEEAAMFIDFLLNSPEVAELQLSDRGLPVNTELREQILPDLTDADKKSAEFLEEIGPDLGDPPALPPPGAGEVQGILQQVNEQLLFDQITVDQAVQQFKQEAERAVG